MFDRLKKLFSTTPPPTFPDLSQLPLTTTDSALQCGFLNPCEFISGKQTFDTGEL